MKDFQEASAKLYHDIIIGLYDNARDAFHIEYGKLIAVSEFIISDDEYIEHMKQEDCKVIYEIWEERYNIKHRKEDK